MPLEAIEEVQGSNGAFSAFPVYSCTLIIPYVRASLAQCWTEGWAIINSYMRSLLTFIEK